MGREEVRTGTTDSVELIEHHVTKITIVDSRQELLLLGLIVDLFVDRYKAVTTHPVELTIGLIELFFEGINCQGVFLSVDRIDVLVFRALFLTKDC